MANRKARCWLCGGAAAVASLSFVVVCCGLSTASVNVAMTNEDEALGREGFFDRVDAKSVEKLRGRCFVLEGEEQTRCHPNIFFFGVSKCGTTSMVKWITKHPQMRWVSRLKTTGVPIKPGQEARALQLTKYKTKEEFAYKYPLTAPEAAQADPVIDCA